MQVMHALNARTQSTEVGWSKPHPDEMVEKLFSTTFGAFKFPDRERLHINCGVQLCRGACPPVDCRRSDDGGMPPPSSRLQRDQHLGFVEVFNSLIVSAPKIESLDRLRAHVDPLTAANKDGIVIG